MHQQNKEQADLPEKVLANMRVILMSHLMNQTTDTAVITHIPGATRERELARFSTSVAISCFLVYLSLKSL